VCHQGRISGSGGLQYHRNDEVIRMKKYFLYFLGLNLIAFAVVLNVRFDLGVAAFSSVMYSISQIYNISLGTASIICYLIFVIIFKMDVAGVALATFTAELVSSILIINCLMKTSTVIHLDIHALKFHKDKVIQIFKIGLPAGLQGAIFSISNILIQSSINSFGSIAMAGNAAAGSLEGFVYQSMNAIYQACVTFTSQNYGINDRKRVDRVLVLCIGIVTVVGLVLGNLVYFFGDELIRIYTTDVQAIAYGHERLLYICVPYFICGWMDVIVGSLRGLGYSTIPMIVSLIGACGLRVLWILTIFQYFHTLNSIYLSYPVTWVVTAAAHLITYMLLRKKAFN
jgi:Na+-driven multidrug efflux pump